MGCSSPSLHVFIHSFSPRVKQAKRQTSFHQNASRRHGLIMFTTLGGDCDRQWVVWYHKEKLGHRQVICASERGGVLAIHALLYKRDVIVPVQLDALPFGCLRVFLLCVWGTFQFETHLFLCTNTPTQQQKRQVTKRERVCVFGCARERERQRDRECRDERESRAG